MISASQGTRGVICGMMPHGTCWFLLISGCVLAAAQPVAAAIVATAQNDPPVVAGGVGLNNNLSHLNEPFTAFPGTLEAMRRITPGMIRYPGGAIAQIWDFVNDSPLPPKSTNSPNGWVDPITYGQFQFQDATNNNYMKTNSVADFYAAWQQAGFTPVFCLNLVTPGKDFYAAKWGRPVNDHPGSADQSDDWWAMLKDRLARSLNMLQRAKAVGLPIKYVELGNEYSLTFPAYYVEAFPNPSGSYAVAADYFGAQIKAAFPGVAILAVADAFGARDGGARDSGWNAAVIPALDRTAIDYLTMHVYIDSQTSDISTYANWCKAVATYDQAVASDLAGSNVPALGAKGWQIFYTEFAPNNRNAPLQGLWGNELLFAVAYVHLLHSGQAAAVMAQTFADCIDSSTYLPNNKGVALALFNNAAAGLAAHRNLTFAGAPPLPGTAFTSLQGVAFTDGTRVHAVVVNASNTDQVVDLSTVVGTGPVTTRGAWLGEPNSTAVPPIVQAAAVSTQVTLKAFSETVVSNELPTYLVNLSMRGVVSAATGGMTAGFYVSGTGRKQLLIRGVGPRLADLGVSGALAQPSLQLVSTGGRANALVGSNTGWTTAPNAAGIVATSAAVGAFPFNGAPPSGTNDTQSSALLLQLSAGTYTAAVTGANGTSGIALVEIYDADNAATRTASLLNLSTLGFAGAGNSTLIGGLVVGGNGPATFLIRGDGPALAAFGVPGILANPTITVYASDLRGMTYTVAGNRAWGQNFNAAQITLAAQSAGAFALTAGSKDSALLITLNPGAYTVQVAGATGSTGTVLLEIYQVP